MIGRQLPLPVQLRDSASFDSYHPGPNSEALAALSGATANVFLFGPPSSGKTHLLQALARITGAAYLPLRELRGFGPEALDGFGAAPALCADDVDAIAQDRDWCIALLRLIDTHRTRGSRCVFAAAAPPERMGLPLPDLRTRLAACAAFGLQSLSDDDRLQLLRDRAVARGLDLPEDAARWLLATQSRDTGKLLAALEQLDQASLSAKRRLTLPFVQSVLGALL